MTRTTQIIKNFSFLNGWYQIPIGKQYELKARIMKDLKITTRQSWLNRLYGKSEPKLTEALAIERAFAKYGITSVWGGEKIKVKA